LLTAHETQSFAATNEIRERIVASSAINNDGLEPTEKDNSRLQSLKAMVENEWALETLSDWTDNCGGQYKCRKNLIHIARLPERYPRMKRNDKKFPMKESFKDIHDNEGKHYKIFLSLKTSGPQVGTSSLTTSAAMGQVGASVRKPRTGASCRRIRAKS
jgi:hypothetical protein